MGNSTTVLDQGIISFKHLCRERNGEVVRTVKPTVLSLSRLQSIWESLKDFDVLFNDYVNGDFSAFINHFLAEVNGELQAAGLLWDVDDVGLFFLNEIRPGISGTAHFTFWDGVFRGREELCQEMLRRTFNVYGFQRIESRVPLYAKKALHAAERTGFIQEGRTRRGAFYRGEWHDVNLYSVLPEDLESIPKNPSKWKNRRLICAECGEKFKQKLGFKSEQEKV